MAKNQQNSKSSGVCKKLYNATLRRMSQTPKNSPPPTAPNVPRVNAAAAARQKLPNSGEVIPAEFDPQLSPSLQQPKEKIAKNQGSFKLKMQDSMNNKFSDYISRARSRMRSTSNVGNAKISLRRDSFNDDVSKYIRRAQGKMRASPTNVADGNSIDIL